MTTIVRSAGLFLLLLAMPSSLPALDQPDSDPLLANAREYTQRYGLKDVYGRAVNDRGKGLPELQGLRNFRAVLPGVLYRAGGNNEYREEPRPNHSPLPPEALENLCREGFAEAIYVYRSGFESATISCQYRGNPHELKYTQLSVGGGAFKDRKFLETVRAQIVSRNATPILVHCWNGYHASGYAPAIALRQFCGFSIERAFDYWKRNAAPGVDAKKMKKNLEAFQVQSDLGISSTQQEALCPPREGI